MTERTPEQVAAIWATLDGLAARIGDAETRDRYLQDWRRRYDEAFPRWLDDSTLVSLPDWKHVAEVSAQERRRAELVSQAWLGAQAVDRQEAAQCKRFAFDLGRRVAAGLIERTAANDAMAAQLGSAVSALGTMRAFERGQRGEHGEALLAAIALDLRCAVLPRSDLGLAERFKLRHGHNFLHTTAKGWLKYDGRRWKVLEEERGVIPAEILAAVFDTVRALQREADAVAATGLARGSVPEGTNPVKLSVETERGKRLLVGMLPGYEPPGADPDDKGTPAHSDDALPHADGLDQLVMTASTCRLLSVTLARFGRSSEDAKRIRCIADLARRWLTVRIQDFDTDPLTINCQNGTLRLLKHADRDGVRVEARLDPHDRADLLTKVAAVNYDPDAQCPNYDSTVEWAQPKAAMRRYLHQWGGYNLTGDMGAQIFHVWWGPLAQNGKSTILDAWADCAGDYAEAGKIETFMEAATARGGDAATPALARLPGVRMLRTGEPPANAKFDESLINQITGQDTLQIRDNFRSFFPARLQIKVTVACNAPPAIPNATEGIKRRVKVVPFEKTMKGATKPDGTPLRDEFFKAKLVPELPGIFARLIGGALDWLEHGFSEPDDVTQWTEEYKDENDPLGRFLDYCTVIEEGARSQASKLHELFVAWSKATGGPEWSIAHLKKRMQAKGHSSKASNGMQWLGLKMVRDPGEFVDEHGNVLDLSGSDASAGGAASAHANRTGATDPPPIEPDDPGPADWADDFDDGTTWS